MPHTKNTKSPINTDNLGWSALVMTTNKNILCTTQGCFVEQVRWVACLCVAPIKRRPAEYTQKCESQRIFSGVLNAHWLVQYSFTATHLKRSTGSRTFISIPSNASTRFLFKHEFGWHVYSIKQQQHRSKVVRGFHHPAAHCDERMYALIWQCPIQSGPSVDQLALKAESNWCATSRT